MPRHNPSTVIDVDDGSDRHGRRLERDTRARTRRRTRRRVTVTPDGFDRQRHIPRQLRNDRDLDQQVIDWRSGLVLQD
ncbi:MAG: hypothetical protein JWN77_2634 [Frankiales bacterium]|jgi:hypothetical protein|nr:hypothetical protein [Frankiales bacterium]